MDIAGRGFGNPGKKLGRGGEAKAEKIAGSSLLGQQESTLRRDETAGRPGQAVYGGVLPGGSDAVCAAPRLPGNVGSDGGTPPSAVRPCRGPGYPGFPGMGLEASALLGDVERIEEGVLIAIDALERAIDRLAITRQMALDMMEE